jgi:hypothetical protein
MSGSSIEDLARDFKIADVDGLRRALGRAALERDMSAAEVAARERCARLADGLEQAITALEEMWENPADGRAHLVAASLGDDATDADVEAADDYLDRLFVGLVRVETAARAVGAPPAPRRGRPRLVELYGFVHEVAEFWRGLGRKLSQDFHRGDDGRLDPANECAHFVVAAARLLALDVTPQQLRTVMKVEIRTFKKSDDRTD